MTIDDRSPSQLKHPNPENDSELTHEQLNHITGGSFEFGKLEVVYTPQKPDGTANYGTGDPDEGGQLHVQTRLR
jgi:bacteriocin-like protein